MREIKFRGLRKDGKGWAYGSLIKLKDDGVEKIYIFNPSELDATEIYDFAPSFEPKTTLKDLFIEVFPETVGQYICSKDENGKKLYEGDVVKCIALDTTEIVIIKDIRNIPIQITGWGYAKNHNVEVIGNIYENPELLNND